MRVGIIGVGRIGTFHAGVLATHPEVERIVLLDSDGSRVAEVAERHGGEVVESLDDLLRS